MGQASTWFITHSADLVPFDEPDDLERLVRLAPGASGSRIRQPDYGDANSHVSFVGVDGHNGYRAYIRFLDAYGIPWVIVSDGRFGIAFGRGRDAPPGRRCRRSRPAPAVPPVPGGFRSGNPEPRHLSLALTQSRRSRIAPT